MKAQILQKEVLAEAVSRMVLHAPDIARHAAAGQFVILRAAEEGERIPLTISDYNAAEGTVTIVYQTVGAATMQLDSLSVGDHLPTLLGPLGRPSEIEGIQKAAVVGGGVGCAIALPVAKALHDSGAAVDVIAGFRSSKLAILQQEMTAASDRFFAVTEDGSLGEQGFVTAVLQRLLQAGERYERVFAIGPLPMMKAVSELTKEYDLPCTVSMNPIMIDGTGMCGCCRLTVDGKVRFACVDGPEFNGHAVNFEEAIRRSRMYQTAERHAREETCHLLEEGRRHE